MDQLSISPSGHLSTRARGVCAVLRRAALHAARITLCAAVLSGCGGGGSAGNGSAPGGAITDAVAPTAPSNVIATAVSAAQINVSWSAATDNVAVSGYRVYRDGGAVPIATVLTTTYSDTGLSAATSYRYSVVALDAANNASPASASAVATTLAGGVAPPPPANSSFEARCADPNVVRCYGFDDVNDLAARVYAPSGGSAGCSGNQCWQVDTVRKSSGAGALRFEVPARSAADSSGSFWLNFKDDLSAQFDSNEEFFVQWRQRYSPEFLSNNYGSDGGGGWKQVIIGTGDQPNQPYYSCSALEVVVVNGYHHGFPQMYNSCTGSTSHGPFTGFEEPLPGADFKLQNARPAPYCLYSQGRTTPPSYFPPAGNCFGYFADEWLTYQVQIQLGPRPERSSHPPRILCRRAPQRTWSQLPFPPRKSI